MKTQNILKRYQDIKETQKGFTLAELIIAAGILGIVIAGILVSYLRCMELNEASRNKSFAVKAARGRMETIKTTPYAALLGTYHNMVFNVTGFTGRGVSYVTIIDAKNTRVDVSVSWRQANGRVYGEDKDLDGILDAGEDKNGDGKLNSPVDISLIIFDRS